MSNYEYNYEEAISWLQAQVDDKKGYLSRYDEGDLPSNLIYFREIPRMEGIIKDIRLAQALRDDLAAGCKIVPGEPTQAMKNEAMQNAFELWEEAGLGDSAPSADECGTIYKDMLSGILFSHLTRLKG